MKWNILVGSLVLGLGLSTQSFGLDLLDRMLGTNYNGCCDKATCCDTPCADPGPSCGCETGCDVQCVPCKPKCRKTPLLDFLRSCKKCKKSSCDGGCDAGCADPGCGVEPACDPGCGVDPACGCDNGCETAAAAPRSAVVRCWTCSVVTHCKKNCCDAGCADPGCGASPLAAAKPLVIRAVALSPLAVAKCSSAVRVRSVAACHCWIASSVALLQKAELLRRAHLRC